MNNMRLFTTGPCSTRLLLVHGRVEDECSGFGFFRYISLNSVWKEISEERLSFINLSLTPFFSLYPAVLIKDKFIYPVYASYASLKPMH